MDANMEQNQTQNISLIQKAAANQEGQYTVRVFANADLVISLNQQTNVVPATEAGLVTPVFSVDGCGDLEVGIHPIDLCQYADFGYSYLVVLNDKTGAHVIVKER